jgi:hypothetical protein
VPHDPTDLATQCTPPPSFAPLRNLNTMPTEFNSNLMNNFPMQLVVALAMCSHDASH